MKKHIPNTITCLNLISGCIATYWAFQGDYRMALLFIIIGAAFDFFDGMSARLLHVSSPIGKELDSLADDITFGFAPSAIVFSFLGGLVATDQLSALIPYISFIMAAFSALRLAKFNLDERQAMGFIGLPTPANALFWGALIVGMGDSIATWPYSVYAILAGSHQQLPAGQRDSHVCPEVQDMGMERQSGEVHLPHHLHPSAITAGNQRSGSHHCLVRHPVGGHHAKTITRRKPCYIIIINY